jgi:hypothetical protein
MKFSAATEITVQDTEYKQDKMGVSKLDKHIEIIT